MPWHGRPSVERSPRPGPLAWQQLGQRGGCPPTPLTFASPLQLSPRQHEAAATEVRTLGEQEDVRLADQVATRGAALDEVIVQQTVFYATVCWGGAVDFDVRVGDYGSTCGFCMQRPRPCLPGTHLHRLHSETPADPCHTNQPAAPRSTPWLSGKLPDVVGRLVYKLQALHAETAPCLRDAHVT